MTLNASSVISFAAFGCYGVLLWLVLARYSRNRTSRFFAYYLASMLVWSFGSFMMFSIVDISTTLFWNRFMLIGSAAMPIAFFGFVQAFLMQYRTAWLWFGGILYAATQVLNALGLVITGSIVAVDKVFFMYGPAITFVSASWLFFIGFSGYLLLREYRRTTDFPNKNRIKYLLVSLLFIFIGSLTNATILQHYPVDITFNILSAGLIAYAILRHRLLDINIVVRKSLLYSIPSAIIGTVYFLVIFLAMRIFHLINSTSIFILALAVAVLAAMLAQPFQASAQNFIDRLFYREKYDANQMLQRLSQSISTVLDLDRLTQVILSEITATLHIQHAGFYLRRGELGEFYLMAQSGMQVDDQKLSSNHPLIQAFNNGSQYITRIDLDILPQFRSLWNQEKSELEQTKAALFLPLRSKGNLIGILAVGPKQSGLTFSQDDLYVLMNLANQMAATIENAMLFASEARRRREAETLQVVLTQLTSDLDLEQVLDNILVNLAPVIPYDSACIFLLQGDHLISVAGRGFENSDKIIGQEHPAAEDQLFLEMQQTRAPVMIPDVSASHVYRGYGNTQDTQSWMGVPLIARGVVIGCLTLDSKKVNTYREAEQSTLALAFASHASVAIENARLFRVEREQRQLAEALREIGTVLSTTLDFDNVLDLLLDQVGRIVPYSIANIMLIEGGRIRIARTRFQETIDPKAAQLLKTLPFNISPAPNLYYMVDTAQPLAIPVVPVNCDWIESPVPIRSWVGAPIVVKGRAIACFSLSSLEPDFYRKRHAELLSVFAGQAALALQNARLFAEIQQLAMVDDLTGIYNRRHFFELGEHEFHRAQRYNRPLAVIMLDLDHFKTVNDTYGHAVGDQVLRMLAERCRSNIREVDILGRYGGEEFTIILPEAGPNEAQMISERLRKHIARMPITTTAGPISITISLGTANLSADIPNLSKLIDCADFAMYEAKRRGRNIVCIYEEVAS